VKAQRTPPTDPFELGAQNRFYDAMSSIQKDVRRGNQAEAELGALALYLWNPTAAWNKILNASTEETIDPLTILAVDVLHRQHEEFGEKADKGVRARLAMLAAGLIANAPKDRTADEMLHLTDFCDILAKRDQLDRWYRDLGVGPDIDRLLVEGVASPELKEKYLRLINRDFVLDLHTSGGLIKGRRRNTVKGETHWDTDASFCANRTPAYEAWREKVYDPIRGWAMGLLRKAEAHRDARGEEMSWAGTPQKKPAEEDADRR